MEGWRIGLVLILKRWNGLVSLTGKMGITYVICSPGFSDIELSVPRTRRMSAVGIVRAYARRVTLGRQDDTGVFCTWAIHKKGSPGPDLVFMSVVMDKYA